MLLFKRLLLPWLISGIILEIWTFIKGLDSIGKDMDNLSGIMEKLEASIDITIKKCGEAILDRFNSLPNESFIRFINQFILRQQ
jgi:hypothetical protein